MDLGLHAWYICLALAGASNTSINTFFSPSFLVSTYIYVVLEGSLGSPIYSLNFARQ